MGFYFTKPPAEILIDNQDEGLDEAALVALAKEKIGGEEEFNKFVAHLRKVLGDK